MTNKRKKSDSSFNTKVTIGTIRERVTLNELAAKYELSPVMISRLRKNSIEERSLSSQYR